MPIWYVCFITGAAAALGGMGLGIAMGIGHDFTLTPVHAHLNLLGWVTMALYGLYYRGAPARIGRLAWVQVGLAIAGLPLMTGGLAFALTGNGAGIAEPLVILGSLLTIAAMALFLVTLLRHATANHPMPSPARDRIPG